MAATVDAPDKNVEYISLMANPLVRGAVKGVAKTWNLVSPLSKVLRDYYTLFVPDGQCPSDAEVEVHLKVRGFDDAEISLATIYKNKYINIDSGGTDALIDAFFARCRRDKAIELQRVYDNERIEDDSLALSNLIKGMSDLNSVGGTKFEVTNYAEIDIDEFIERRVNAPKQMIKSRFNLIKDLSHGGAYEKGWIVQVVAPPGTAKTQFLLNEAEYFARQRLNICWVALGDMDEVSMYKRLIGLITRTNRFEVAQNLNTLAKDPDVIATVSYIDFVFKSASDIAASDLVNSIISQESAGKHYDVIIIDYDDNLKAESTSMFEQGGHAYAELTRLSKRGAGTANPDYKLVLIASQAKPEFWSKEEMPLQAAATSSQKQARVDVMITINRKSNTHSDIGTMCIVKHRHGGHGKTKYHLENYGRIRGITPQEYDALIASTSTTVSNTNRAVGEDNELMTNSEAIVI